MVDILRSAREVPLQYFGTVTPLVTVYTAAPEDTAESENKGAVMNNDAELHGAKDVGNVDEQKVMEVLKQDLFETMPEDEG